MRRSRRRRGEEQQERQTAPLKKEEEAGRMQLRRSTRSSQLPTATPSRRPSRPVGSRKRQATPKKAANQVELPAKSADELPGLEEASASDDQPTPTSSNHCQSRRKKTPRQKEETPNRERESTVGREEGGDQSIEANQYQQSTAQHLADAMLLMPADAFAPRRVGRRTKLIPEERILLAQLYHDHFAIYHSRRYVSANFYVYPELNLKHYLQTNWAERLNRLMLGCFNRTPADIEEFITEMVNEVKEVRRLRDDKMQMVGIQSCPSFILINKIYDFIDAVHPKIEEILDKFEQKLILDREDHLMRGISPGTLWRDDEKQILLTLYVESAADYDVNVLRRDGVDKRGDVLRHWEERFASLGIPRREWEMERKICAFRREYRDFKESESKMAKSKRPRQVLSPLAAAFGKEWIDSVDQEMNVDKLLRETKPIHDEILRGEVKEPSRADDLPGVALFPNVVHCHTVYEFPTNSCRTNRPHMSRRERYLLAMLYRQNYKDYEQFNTPHMTKKSSDNKKWILLKEWAEMLSTLGVSQRDPEELATKISQYKNIVKNHKQCAKEGVSSLFMKNEYKMRRIQRPLSPTTKLFDLSDSGYDDEATEEKIRRFLDESHTLLNYPYAAMPSKKNESPGKGSQSDGDSQVDETPEITPSVGNVQAVKLEVEAEATEDDHQRASPDAQQTVADYILDNLVPKPLHTQQEEEINTIFEAIYADCRRMESQTLTTLTYDVIDSTGIVTKMAMTREENYRDVNFFLWTKYMDVEMDQQLGFYICYACEQMSTAKRGRPRCREASYPPLPGCGILAQQALPTVAITTGGKQVHIGWSKNKPTHRCVPFLMSTICEKLASLSHMIVRTAEVQSETDAQ